MSVVTWGPTRLVFRAKAKALGIWGRLRLALRLFWAGLTYREPRQPWQTPWEWRLGETHSFLKRWEAQLLGRFEPDEGQRARVPRDRDALKMLWELRVVLGYEDTQL